MKKIVYFEAPSGYRAVGLWNGRDVLDFSRALGIFCAAEMFPADFIPFSILDMVEGGFMSPDLIYEVSEFIEEHKLAPALTVENARFLAPIPRPPRIIALGLNYAAHAAEGGWKPPKEPIFFIKASTAVIAPDEPVVIPRRVGRVDHEVELAVIIGRGGRRISRAKAPSHIAGYTIMNDVTARDWQRRDMAASRPWFISKSLDTFAPMGPCVVLPEDIQDPSSLALSLSVNGEVRQKSNTKHMIFAVPEIIHRLSRHITLEPGDVISTGTPEGISPIQPGDVMEAEVEKIGVLRNPVIEGR